MERGRSSPTRSRPSPLARMPSGRHQGWQMPVGPRSPPRRADTTGSKVGFSGRSPACRSRYVKMVGADGGGQWGIDPSSRELFTTQRSLTGRSQRYEDQVIVTMHNSRTGSSCTRSAPSPPTRRSRSTSLRPRHSTPDGAWKRPIGTVGVRAVRSGAGNSVTTCISVLQSYQYSRAGPRAVEQHLKGCIVPGLDLSVPQKALRDVEKEVGQAHSPDPQAISCSRWPVLVSLNLRGTDDRDALRRVDPDERRRCNGQHIGALGHQFRRWLGNFGTGRWIELDFTIPEPMPIVICSSAVPRWSHPHAIPS